MRKYLLFTAILALCACNNGGGHGGGDIKHNFGNSGGVSGGTTINPGEKPGDDDTTEKPTPDDPIDPMPDNPDNPDNPSPDTPEPETKPILELKSGLFHWFYTNSDKQYTQQNKGTIDKNTNEVHLELWMSEDGEYDTLCDQDGGCDFKYKYGEYYLVANIKEIPEPDSGDDNVSETAEPEIIYELKQCSDADGCLHHVDKDMFFKKYCRDAQGCVIPENIVTLKLNELDGKDGIYVKSSTKEEMGDFEGKREDIIALGSESYNIPLRYSDFGYWVAKYYDSPRDMTSNETFAAGVPSKEVDMKTLAEIQEISGTHTYTGGAFVVISSGHFDYVNESITEKHEGKDTANGFSGNGTAKLTFEANGGVPKESILMNFSDAGWYNVYMNGDGSGVRLFGNPVEDKRFKPETMPAQTSDIAIHYYGDNTTKLATEVVGTANMQHTKMQDGLYRNISFSFGAVKDE